MQKSQHLRSYRLPAVLLFTVVLPGAIYLNHVSARWVPDAEAKVRAAQKQKEEEVALRSAQDVKQNPNSASAQVALARTLAEKKQFVAALVPAERAVTLEPKNEEAVRLLALLETTAGYPSQAIAHYRRAIALNPNDLEAYQHWGDLLIGLNDMRGAETVFRQAKKQNPNIVGPLLSLARIKQGQNRSQETLDLLEPVLKGSSPPVAALYLAGKACEQLGKTQQGAELLEKAIQQQPDFADAYHALGSMECNQGKNAIGIPHLEKAVSLDPENPIYHYALGNAYLAEVTLPDHLQKARQEFEISLEKDPLAEWTHYYYGSALEQLGETEGALREYRRTLEINPEFDSARYRLGVTLRTLGRESEAKTYLDAFDRHSKQAITAVHDRRRDNSIVDTAAEHYRRGMRMLQAGDREKAIEDFRVALSRDPNYTPAKYELNSLTRDRP